MKFSASIVAALAATPLVAAVPAPYAHVDKKWVVSLPSTTTKLF
jgi:hypothetical protein